VSPSVPTATPTEGALLVRIPAPDRGWVGMLPAAPAGTTLTVTVGHVGLLPVPVDDLIGAGYRIVGGAAADRPVGLSVDVLVPRHVRVGHPEWFAGLRARAGRVFDLRHGPVLRVLAAEIELHLRALDA
jgi:hypothetical protein